MNRLASMDLLRGLIIILMAIDHASYFIAKVHYGEFWGVALPEHASAATFLTRAITHLAAPGFSFLMGCSLVFLATARSQQQWSTWQIQRHLMLRGALLILLQHVLENPAWLLGTIGVDGSIGLSEKPGGGEPVLLHFGVLYGLGSSMIVCALLIQAPAWLTAALGLAAIVLTQALVPHAAEAATLFSPLQRLLLIPGHTDIWQVYYPLLPWFGVAALGMAFARWLQVNPSRGLNLSGMLGLGLLAVFFLIRLSDGFGNSHVAAGDDWMALLHVTKYPPSLAFLSLTLGVNLCLLFMLHQLRHWLAQPNSPLLVFGQTALGFYLLHLYIYALLGFGFLDGASLPTMYMMWLVGLLLLYPLCWYYRRFKQQTASDSIWRLF